jgi:hypothetical protein
MVLFFLQLGFRSIMIVKFSIKGYLWFKTPGRSLLLRPTSNLQNTVLF